MVFKMRTVLTNVICGFIVFLNLFQENESTGVRPRIIFPPQNFYTAASGSNFTARCQSDYAPFWNKRGRTVDFDIMEYDYTDDEALEEILELTDLSYHDVGFYDCGRRLFHNSFSTSSFYLFVDDPVHLTVGPGVVRMEVPKDQPLILPCRPTTQDVTVKLFTSEGHPVEFSMDPFDEDKKLYFDPRSGFIFPEAQKPVNWCIYLCEFTKRGVRQEMKIDLLLDSVGTTNVTFVHLQRQVGTDKVLTAKLGSTVQFVAEVFSQNYSYHNVTWMDNTGKKIVGSKKHLRYHSLENHVWEAQLKILNVTEADVGTYTVSYLDSQLEFELKIEDSTLMMHIGPIDLLANNDPIVICIVNSDVNHNIKWRFRTHDCYGNNCGYIDPSLTQFNMVKTKVTQQAAMISLRRTQVGNITCFFEDKDNHTISVTKPFFFCEIKEGFGIITNTQAQNYKIVATLTCVVSRYLYSNHVYWIGPGGFVIEKNYTVGFTYITLAESETEFSFKLELRFLNATEAVNGRYRCMAVDYQHTPALKNEDLRIPSGLPPKVTESNLQNPIITAVYMKEMNLTCRSDGFPEPEVHWSVDGIYVDKGHNGILELGPVKQSGHYKCRILNEYGIEERSILLRVVYELKAPANLTFSLLDLAAGQNVTLSCDTEDYQYSNITWYKDTKLIEESIRMTFSEWDSKLTISSVSRADAGLYSCSFTIIEYGGFTVDRNLTDFTQVIEISRETGPTVWGLLVIIVGVVFLLALLLLMVRIIRLRRSGALFNYKNIFSH